MFIIELKVIKRRFDFVYSLNYMNIILIDDICKVV